MAGHIRHEKAAEYYDKSAALQPNDWNEKAQTLFYAVETHLRAGNTISVFELFRRMEEAEQQLSKICLSLPLTFLDIGGNKFDLILSRSTVYVPGQKPADPEHRSTTLPPLIAQLKTQIAALPPQARMGPTISRSTIKAVPMLDLRGTPTSFSRESVKTSRSWDGKPGHWQLVEDIPR
ncbi:hypothetical protein JCM8547_007420 [Rhodosporidiobolus lusitaniae]